MDKRTVKPTIITVILACLLGSLVYGLAFNLFSHEPVYAAESKIATPTDSGACGENLTWEYYADTKTLTISGSGAMTSYSEGKVPWYSYRNEVESIVVGNEITTISFNAFYGFNSLKEITLPFVGGAQNQTSASNSAVFGYIFGTGSYGDRRTEQRYGSSGGSYGYYCIPQTLRRVTITNEDKLFYGAFYNCAMLTEINLNDEITTIADYAFA